MNTNREICMAEGFLLTTWLQIDALALNEAGQNMFTETVCRIFMVITAAYFVSFILRKNKSIIELGKALWRSNYFDGMGSLALVIPWIPVVWAPENIGVYLSYILWGLAIITFLFGVFSKRDRSLETETYKLQQQK